MLRTKHFKLHHVYGALSATINAPARSASLDVNLYVFHVSFNKFIKCYRPSKKLLAGITDLCDYVNCTS